MVNDMTLRELAAYLSDVAVAKSPDPDRAILWQYIEKSDIAGDDVTDEAWDDFVIQWELNFADDGSQGAKRLLTQHLGDLEDDADC
jgi:hypothetical protein